MKKFLRKFKNPIYWYFFLLVLAFSAGLGNDFALLRLWGVFYDMLPEHFFFRGEFWLSRYFYGHFNVLFQMLLVFGGVLLFGAYRRKERKKTELAAIIILLSVNILFAAPCLCASRWQAREVSCRSNIKQIGCALSAYAEDNNGHFPNDLHDLKEYIGGSFLFICPGRKIPFADTSPPSVPDYLYRGKGKTLSDLPTLLLEDKPRNHPGNVRHHYYGDGIIVSSRFGEQPVAPAKK